jgi:3-deoxy-D-manno-octulosonic-acid transferase
LRVYGLITRLLTAPALLYFYGRGIREPAYRRHWRERLGLVAGVEPGAIWIHAASVGEVALVGLLLDALRARYPEKPLLLTTMTPTGRARAAARFGDAVAIRYIPLDTPGATRRFIRRIQPRLAVFAETELWPNLIAATTAAGVPLALINARISARSAARYGCWPLARMAAFTLARVAAIGAASDVHAQRFKALGAPPAQVTITGNLKYDGAACRPNAEAVQRLRDRWQERPVWVAASTHEGEEALLLEAFALVARAHPNILLVLAPRHPQRFDTVARLLKRRRVKAARRSQSTVVEPDTAVVLADTLGEVPLFYAAADVVFVGGSLVPGIGGHNVIEAAGCARPVCVGSHVHEWREVVDALISCRAAAVCATPAALAAQINYWLSQPQAARAAGAAVAACVAARRGALARSLELIDALLEPQNFSTFRKEKPASP